MLVVALRLIILLGLSTIVVLTDRLILWQYHGTRHYIAHHILPLDSLTLYLVAPSPLTPYLMAHCPVSGYHIARSLSLVECSDEAEISISTIWKRSSSRTSEHRTSKTSITPYIDVRRQRRQSGTHRLQAWDKISYTYSGGLLILQRLYRSVTCPLLPLSFMVLSSAFLLSYIFALLGLKGLAEDEKVFLLHLL